MAVTRVERLRSDDLTALRQFLRGRPETTVFHSPEWLAVILAAYGHACDYWVARSGNAIAGIFPVSVVRTPGLGAKMIAMAYQMDTGLPIAESSDAARALIECAVAEAKRAAVRYLEVRSLTPAPELSAAGFIEVPSGLVTTIVGLEGMESGRIRRNHRRNLRAAAERGVTVIESRATEDFRRFHRLYLREGRSMGAPQAGWPFFESLHRHAPASYRLYLALFEDRVIGGLVTLGDERVVYARHAAYNSSEALELHAGAALYWRAIRDAAEAGAERFNCGISWEGDTGLIHWKEGWSGHSVPVQLSVLPVRGHAPRAGDYLSGFRLAKAVWRRLPLPLAEFGGQLVTKWVC